MSAALGNGYQPAAGSEMTPHDHMRAALAYVPPTDRETWLKMGMAVKSELGEDGFELWDEWSQADESYRNSDARAVWRSIHPDGGITCATLYHEAKQHGWRDKPNGNGAHKPRASRHQAHGRLKDEERSHEHEQAAIRAAAIWNEARDALADHPYLVRKGIKPHGLKLFTGSLVIAGVNCHRALLIPMFSSDGELHSLEFIPEVGDKRYLPDGRTAGCYYAIGTPRDAIVIAEGFATAVSIYEATGVAVACALSAGNLIKVARSLRDKLPAVRLVIAGDRDEHGVGQRAAEAAALAVGGYLAIPSSEHPGKDWNDVHRLAGADAVRIGIDSAEKPDTRSASVARVASVAAGDIEPETLRRPLPPAEPYPLEALGPILGSAAHRIHEVVQAPAALCGQSILAAASLAAQAHADIEIDGRRELLSLFAFSIADSGERKTAVDRHALQPHREYERKAFDAHRHEVKAYEIELAAYEASRRNIQKGKKTSQQIKSAFEDLGPPPAAPADPILLAPSPTLEGIHKLYSIGRPSLGLFHDDAGEFLGGHSMSDEHRMKSAAGLSRLWDAGEFDRIRAGDGANKYFGRRLSSHLMVQPVVAERVLSDDILTGQGLLARALLVWPTSTIGSRSYIQADLTKDPALGAYRDRVSGLLERPLPFREGTTNELEPRTLVLTSEARRSWIAVHDSIELDQKEGGAWAGVRAWASKAPSQVLRIAGVLTLVEQPDAGVVHSEAIDRAAALIEHYLREAARIVGTASVPVEIRNAEALRDWCHGAGIHHLHSRAALQFGPAGIRTAATFDRAIEVLEKTGWAERLEDGAEIDGKRRRRAWKIRRPTP